MTSPELWTPSEEALLDRPAPTQKELLDLWKTQYDPSGEFRALDEFFSVYRIPETPPDAVISIDLCEVVRDTCGAIGRMGGLALEDMIDKDTQAGDYGAYSLNIAPDPRLYYRITLLAQELMHHNLVEFNERVDLIAQIVRTWRERANVYCVANTSTNEGCELPTIQALRQHMPDCFDGILLPRNFHGKGKVTKGVALRKLVDQIAPHREPLVTHIDDLHHHLQGFKEQFPHSVGFMPAYGWNQSTPTEVATRHESPLLTFLAVDRYLGEHLT